MENEKENKLSKIQETGLLDVVSEWVKSSFARHSSVRVCRGHRAKSVPFRGNPFLEYLG